MAKHGWGHDPGFIEDSKSIQRKLFWLALLSSAGGVAFALNRFMFGVEGNHWLPCLLAAASGAAGFVIFSRGENLALVVGIIPGLIAGSGAYAATVGYLSFRDSVRFFELLLPSLIGSAPGLLAYIIMVRLYYHAIDKVNG